MVGGDFEAVSEAKKQKVATYASELKETLFESRSFQMKISNLEFCNDGSFKG